MSLIIKLTDPKDNKVYYLEWSTMQDTPLTNGVPLDEFKSYYKEKYGTNGMRELEGRLIRVENMVPHLPLKPLTIYLIITGPEIMNLHLT